MCLLAICLSSLEKYLFRSFACLIELFVFLMYSCINCLYILEINPLLLPSFANIFSHSVGCLFILLVTSFAVQKLLSLIRSLLFIFGFVSITLRDRSNRCCNLCQSVMPMFSPMTLIVFGPTCRSLVHFEFIFVYGVKEVF